MNNNLIKKFKLFKTLSLIAFVISIILAFGTILSMIILIAMGLVLIAVVIFLSNILEFFVMFILFQKYKYYKLMIFEYNSINLKINDKTKNNNFDKELTEIKNELISLSQNNNSLNNFDEYVQKLSCSKMIESDKFKDILIKYFEYMTEEEINDIKNYINEEDYKKSINKILNNYILTNNANKIKEHKSLFVDVGGDVLDYYSSNDKKEYFVNLINDNESKKICSILNELEINEKKSLLNNMEEKIYLYAQTNIEPMNALDILNAIINYKDAKIIYFKIAFNNKCYEELLYCYNNYFVEEYNKVIYDYIINSINDQSEWYIKMFLLINGYIKEKNNDLYLEISNNVQQQQQQQHQQQQQLQFEMINIINKSLPSIDKDEMEVLKNKYDPILFKNTIKSLSKMYIKDNKKTIAKIVLSLIFDLETSNDIVENNKIDEYL